MTNIKSTKVTRNKKNTKTDKINYKTIDKIANILSPSREDYLEELSILNPKFSSK